MSTMTGTRDDTSGDIHAAEPAGWARLPLVASEVTPADAMDRLRTASKRGRLPGFEPRPGGFRLDAWGRYVDYELRASVEAHGSGCRVRFQGRLPARVPAVALAVTALTIWPGVHLLDGMIPASWNWIDTWIWYVPLTAVSSAWALWKGWRDSSRSALASAHEMIGKVAAELGGRPDP